MGSKILGLQFMRSVLQLKRILSTSSTSSSSSCMTLQCPFGRGMKTRTRTKTSMIKVIRSDGVVNIYEQRIQVSELMMEFPKHMVCSSDSFYIGQKIPALSEHDHLLPGHSYFLLPNHLFQSVLSFVTITSFLDSSRHRDHHLKKALLTCQPFHVHKTPSGYLRVNVSEEFISQLMITEDHQSTYKQQQQQQYRHRHHHHHASSRVLCTTLQLQKDYDQLVSPARRWKPKLETIKETREKRRRKLACGKNKKSQPNGSSSSSHKTQKSKPKVKVYDQSTPKSRGRGGLIHPHHRNKIKAFLATTSSRGRKRMI